MDKNLYLNTKNIILIICFIFIGCKAGLKHLNQFDGFNGNPKKVEMTGYKIEYKDSIPTENMGFKDINFYDSIGRKTKTLMYKSDGSLSTGGVYYNYDKYGNLIESIMYKEDGTINIKNLYKYDKFGFEIERLYIRDTSKTVTKKVYDRKNKTVQIIGKNPDGSFKENAIQKHDEKWNKTEFTSFDSLGNQKTRIEFIYDHNMNLNSSKWYNENNELYDFSKTTFNRHDDPVKSIGYRVKGKDTILNKTAEFEYEYDSKQNLLEKKIFTDGKWDWTIKYEYEY